MMPEISVVIPCFNEEENVEAIYLAAARELEGISCDFDILFIDNASTDNTVSLIKKICERDTRVRLIVNTRNFGQMRSPTHAVLEARGSAVIGLCADFQDPPELMPRLIQEWRAGADIVLGVREDEKAAGFLLRSARRVSYWAAKHFSDYPILPNATGFGLYDQRVIAAIKAIREPEPFFRGLLIETGFKIKTIPYARPPRSAGASKNNFFALFSFAASALASSSKRLLRVPIYVGVACMVFAFLLGLGALIALLAGEPVENWTIGFIVQFQVGVLFCCLGLLAENVRLIAERTRGTPLVVEEERVNFPQGSDAC